MKRETGFSLLELLVVTVIIGFVLAAGSDMFVGLMRDFRQQGKITETNIEGTMGLEILRRDIEGAGYGLPLLLASGITYQEATDTTAAHYNDVVGMTSSPPRAIVSDDNLLVSGIVQGSDYLVVKSTTVANSLPNNDACTKYALLTPTGVAEASGTFNAGDQVAVISPGDPTKLTTYRKLMGSDIYSGASATTSTLRDSQENRIIFGVDAANLRMPFNRADYYVSTSAAKPDRCASGTGVLVKAVVSQVNGGFGSDHIFPLLDCVADMQVIDYLDLSPVDGQWDTKSDTMPLTTAADVRQKLKEVHIFILAQEGGRDPKYDASKPYPTGAILVGESSTLGRYYDLTAIPDWKMYRWKVYTLIVNPISM